MASRQVKMPAKNSQAEQEAEEVFSQSKRPERGRYLLQVDRQTKNSYATSEAAQSAALAIKTGAPCPLYTRKRTFVGASGMSALCQKASLRPLRRHR